MMELITQQQQQQSQHRKAKTGQRIEWIDVEKNDFNLFIKIDSKKSGINKFRMNDTPTSTKSEGNRNTFRFFAAVASCFVFILNSEFCNVTFLLHLIKCLRVIFQMEFQFHLIS